MLQMKPASYLLFFSIFLVFKYMDLFLENFNIVLTSMDSAFKR